MKYKDYEIVHGENEKNLASAVNKKLNEGFVLIGELKIVPRTVGSTQVGYEVHRYNFYQAIAKPVTEE